MTFEVYLAIVFIGAIFLPFIYPFTKHLIPRSFWDDWYHIRETKEEYEKRAERGTFFSFLLISITLLVIWPISIFVVPAILVIYFIVIFYIKYCYKVISRVSKIKSLTEEKSE